MGMRANLITALIIANLWSIFCFTDQLQGLSKEKNLEKSPLYLSLLNLMILWMNKKKREAK